VYLDIYHRREERFTDQPVPIAILLWDVESLYSSQLLWLSRRPWPRCQGSLEAAPACYQTALQACLVGPWL